MAKKVVTASNGHTKANVIDPKKVAILEAAVFSRYEALSLLDMYYSIQKLRVGSSNKKSAHDRMVDYVPEDELVRLDTLLHGTNVDPEVLHPESSKEQLVILDFLKTGLLEQEKMAAKGLEKFAKGSPLGQWCLQIHGMNAILTAGFLASIDLQRCCCETYHHHRIEKTPIPPHDCPGLPTYGAILRFAGQLDPKEQRWGKGERRPYNQRLKTICWKIGASFRFLSPAEGKRDLSDKELLALATGTEEQKEKKVTRFRKKLLDLASPEYLYVRLYMERKKMETERNEAGYNKQAALDMLDSCNKRKVSISDTQRACWESGKIQKCGVDLRAMRYAVKIFISHYHHVGREILGLPKVVPYPIAHKGHAHYIPPPCWPMK